MSSFKVFLRWYKNKDVVPTIQAKQRTMPLHHNKDTGMLKLGCRLPNLSVICLHKSTDAKMYPFTEGNKDLLQKKIEKTLLVAVLSFLHAKQLLMKLLFESLQADANLLLGLMPTNHTPTRCINPRPPVFIRVEISIQQPLDSHLGKTRTIALKLCSCLIFKEGDLIVKWRVSTLQAGREK